MLLGVVAVSAHQRFIHSESMVVCRDCIRGGDAFVCLLSVIGHSVVPGFVLSSNWQTRVLIVPGGAAESLSESELGLA